MKFDLTHSTYEQAIVLGKLNGDERVTSDLVAELDSFFYKGQAVDYIVGGEIFTGEIADSMVKRTEARIRIIRKDENGAPVAIDRVNGADVQAQYDFTSEIGEAVAESERNRKNFVRFDWNISVSSI